MGLGLAAIFLASVLFNSIFFLVFLSIAITLGILEISNEFRSSGYKIPTIILIACCVTLNVVAYFGGVYILGIAFFWSIFSIVIFVSVDNREKSFLVKLGPSMFVLIYIGLMSSFATLTVNIHNNGVAFIITFAALVCGNDIGGLVFGSFFGKHKIAPNISPKKSLEGLFGSFLFALAISLFAIFYIEKKSLMLSLILAIATVSIATFGDICESAIKRDLGIKDFGTILPGHGGVMDRLDSLLFFAPFFYMIVMTIN